MSGETILLICLILGALATAGILLAVLWLNPPRQRRQP